MERVGVAFRSPLTADEVRDRYVKPLRAALEGAGAGIYTNYLRQTDCRPGEQEEHLLMFLVNDFREGLRLLRLELEEIGAPEGTTFQNLNPSDPPY